MPQRLLSFDGYDFDRDNDPPYLLGLDLDNRAGWNLDPQTRQRANQSPIREVGFVQPRDYPFVIIRNPDYTGTTKTPSEFRQEMMTLLSPYLGERVLIALGESGDTVFIQVDVTELDFWTGDTGKGSIEDAELVGVFRATDPIWRTVDTVTSTTNGGRFKALPVITIAPTATATKRTYIVSAGAADGVAGYPVKLPFTAFGNTWIFDRGRSIPFVAAGGGTWVRVNIAKGASIQLDCFTGGADNPSADDLDLGGLDPASTNSQWTFNNWLVSEHPNGPGNFKPMKTGLTFQGVSYGITDDGETTGSLTIAIAGGDKYDRMFDSVAMNFGVPASSITLTAEANDLVDARVFVKKIVRHSVRPGATAWKWDTEEDGTGAPLPLYDDGSTSGDEVANAIAAMAGDFPVAFDSPISLGGAIGVIIGIEPIYSIERTHVETDTDGGTSVAGDGIQRALGSITISGDAIIALSGGATVSGGATSDCVALNGATLTNGANGDSIIFKQAFFTGSLAIDCYNKTIVASTGRCYADIRFTDQDDWLALEPGANSLSGVAATVAYHERYLT